MTTDAIAPGSGILRKTQEGLAANLLRAMQVSGLTENGEPTKRTQQSVAKESGIARSTISKYVAQHSDANPDLETLCRLAATMNVSPAMLLMTAEDWLQLANALVVVNQANRNESISTMIEKLSQESNNRPQVRASTVLQMAKYVGIDYQADSESSRKMRQGILATAAMPSHPKFEQGIYTYLLPLCIVMGARIIDQRE